MNTSQLLLTLLEGFKGERVHLADLNSRLGERGFGLLLLLFALPVTLPVSLPGLSTVLALPLVFLSLQMLQGRSAPHLPGWLARRSLRQRDLTAFASYAVPWLKRLERLLRPRWSWLTDHRVEPLLGGLCLVLAVILLLPIPLVNMLPALAVCLMALGLMEKDGVLVALGLGAALTSLVLTSAVVWTMAQSILFLLQQLLF